VTLLMVAAQQVTADWRVGDVALEIPEDSAVLAEQAVIQEFPPETWQAIGITIVRTPSTPSGLWTVRSGRKVGVARLGADSGYAPQVRIQPKFEAADIFFLADHAWGRNRDLLEQSRLEATLASLRADPAACLLSWFLGDLSTFVRRSLRHDYVLRQEVFAGKVRGRVLLSEYVRQQLPRAQPHRVPCQFFEFTRDNLANRVLKATLRAVTQMIPEVRVPEARIALRAQAETISPFLSAVGDQEIRRDDFNRLRLRGPLRHYQRMVEKCRAMLDRAYMSTELGRHVQSAFLWDMGVLFQEAVRGLLIRESPAFLSRTRGDAQLRNTANVVVASSKVDPDFVLRQGPSLAILDAKYKDTRVGEGSEDEILVADALPAEAIRIKRSDIYQLIAYGRHDAHRATRLGLVYPVTLQTGQPLPSSYRVTGFAEEVQILFVDIGNLAQQSVPEFVAQVSDLFG
jgi:5-methylcytosine-specific restriction enzyme subunit McrC